MYKNTRLDSFIIASAMISMPLFRVTSGFAGSIYLLDIIGLCLFAYYFIRYTANSKCKYHQLSLFIIPILLVIVLPLFSTVYNNMFVHTRIDLKVIGLSVMRGISYLSVLNYFIQHNRQSDLVESYILISIISFPILCIVGLVGAYIGVNLNPTLNALDYQTYISRNELGTGFLFLYRGAVGAWGAAIISITPFVFLIKRLSAPLKTGLFIIATSSIFYGIIKSGSRQGLLIGVATFLLALLIVFIKSDMKSRMYSLSSILIVFVLLSSIIVNNKDTYDWLITRFFTSESLSQGVESRDTVKIAKEFLANPDFSIIGYGILPENSIVTGNTAFLYVDSELVWTLQKIGILGVLLYAIYLIILLLRVKNIISVNWIGYPMLCTLLAGYLLIPGHFFILHLPPSATVINYWYWILIGMASSNIFALNKKIQIKSIIRV